MIPILIPAALGLIGGYLSREPKKYHLGGDMSKHLAPNGKPSNLTHEQWHLVRTPEFKAWFGDWERAYETGNYEGVSKVIDEETKEPLVVYHGTTHGFNQFTKERANLENHFGSGYYFSDSLLDVESNYLSGGSDLTNRIESLADRLSSEKDIDYNKAKLIAEKKLKGKKEKILYVFLNFKNPLNLDEMRYDEYEIENEEGEYEVNEDGLPAKLYEALKYASSEFNNWEMADKIFYEVSDTIGYDWGGTKAITVDKAIRESSVFANAEFVDNDGNLVSNEYLRRVYELMDFDGIIMDADAQFGRGRKFGRRMVMDYGTKHYIAFEPNQIKLADGRNKKFDSNNPDIRYADGGEIKNLK
jgi:hypothetical protein